LGRGAGLASAAGWLVGWIVGLGFMCSFDVTHVQSGAWVSSSLLRFFFVIYYFVDEILAR